MNKDWMKRRWFEFRTGYSTYIIFLFGFSNFLLILYNLAPAIKNYIEFLPFMLIILIVIIPLGVIVGRKHFDKQYNIETMIGTEKNPYIYKVVPKSIQEIILRTQVNQLIFTKQILTGIVNDKEALNKSLKIIDKNIENISDILSGQDSRSLSIE